MAKESRIAGAILYYRELEKWEYPDALHLWALEFDNWYQIAECVRKRHNLEADTRAVESALIKDLQEELGLRYQKERVEGGEESIGAVVERLFDRYCASHFQDMVKERRKRLSRDAKRLLDLVLETEESLLKDGRIRSNMRMDEIKRAYKKDRGQECTQEIIDGLVRAGMINERRAYSKSGKTFWDEWVASRYALPLLRQMRK